MREEQNNDSKMVTIVQKDSARSLKGGLGILSEIAAQSESNSSFDDFTDFDFNESDESNQEISVTTARFGDGSLTKSSEAHRNLTKQNNLNF